MKFAIALTFLCLACLANAASIKLAGLTGPSFGIAHPKLRPQLEQQSQPKSEQLSEDEYDPESEEELEHNHFAQTILNHVRPKPLPQLQPDAVLQHRPAKEPEAGRKPWQVGYVTELHRPHWHPMAKPQPESESEAEVEAEAELENAESESYRDPQHRPQQLEFQREPEFSQNQWQNRPHRQPKPQLATVSESGPAQQSWVNNFAFNPHRPYGYPQPEQVQEEEQEDDKVEELAQSKGNSYLQAFGKPSPYFVIPNFNKYK